MSGLLRSLIRRVKRLQESQGEDYDGSMLVVCIREDETNEASLARHGITPEPHQLVVLITDYGGHGSCEHCRQAGEAPRQDPATRQYSPSVSPPASSSST